MATALKSKPPTDSRPEPKATPRGGIGRALWSVYRFLASLKLAVICLSSLAGVLAYATFFESWYGTKAVQQSIYQAWWFGVLLAFLGTNILCAALIRYPWKKRQTGFVVTHAGLLVVLIASLLTAWICDEGQVAIVEGERSDQMIQSESPVIRVRPLDPRTGKPVNDREYVMDFHSGAYAWPEGRSAVLSQKGDPFEFRVRSFLPAAIGRFRHASAPSGEDGEPMIRLSAAVTPPMAVRPVDLFFEDVQESEKWFVASGRFRRKVKQKQGVRLIFQALAPDSPTDLDDFLNPPKDLKDAARIHYVDQAGQPRVHVWPLEESQPGTVVTLPDSDLTVTFQGLISLPDAFRRIIGRQTGEDEFPGAKFDVKKGDGPTLVHYGWWAPVMPSYIPSENDPKGTEPLVRIGYFHDPHFDGERRSSLEIVASPDGKLHHRYLNRSGVQSIGPMVEGKELTIGGGPNQPVSLVFAVQEFLPRGKESFGFAPLTMAKGKQGEGIPAVLATLTVDGETKEFWLRGQAGLEPNFAIYQSDGTQRRAVEFPSRAYEVGYDVERMPLPYSLKLVKFKKRFDPGTAMASEYTSYVQLTDEAAAIRDQPITITMNEPLTYKGRTFYQSSFQELEDPATGQKTGQSMSILQVRYDPVWPIMYGGCGLVVLGCFLQFYMRAGIFTDGGKRERERAARSRPGNTGSAGTDEPEPSAAPAAIDTL